MIFNIINPNVLKKHLKMPDFIFCGFCNHFKADISPFIFSIKQVEFCKLNLNRGLKRVYLILIRLV